MTEDQLLSSLLLTTENATLKRVIRLYRGSPDARKRLDQGIRLAVSAKIVGELLLSLANAEFIRDPKFIEAYAAAWRATTRDIRWRFYTLVEMGGIGLSRPGVFVEAGVKRGFSMFGLLTYYPDLGRTRPLYLFDTFDGVVPDQMTEAEKVAESGKQYPSSFEFVTKRFSPFPAVKIIKGRVPETLNQFTEDAVAFLHIDMNVAYPEIEALKFFWPKMSLGAPILFDDYGFPRHHEQKHQLDALVQEWGRSITLLPTGQGLLIK